MAAKFIDVIRTVGAAFEAELAEETLGGLRLSVDAEGVLALLTRLRGESEISMSRLVDLTAIDRGDRPHRFEVVYSLHSPNLNERLRVHVGLDEPRPVVDSVVELWPAANWLEREVFDLFGIEFRGHPDLRRILLESNFEGAPLRKDYARQPNLALPKGAAE